MAAAYFIVHNRVTDDPKMQEYIPKAVQSIFGFGGEVLVVEDNCQVVEGKAEFPRTVIVKFESREKAEAWYNSDDYAAVRPLRLEATEGWAVLVDEFQMG